jgi:hypothetical protein
MLFHVRHLLLESRILRLIVWVTFPRRPRRTWGSLIVYPRVRYWPFSELCRSIFLNACAKAGSRPTSHQRESFCVKLPAGARSVVCPCIAVMGWSQQRVIGLVRPRTGLPMMSAEITTGVSMPRRARPGRQFVPLAPQAATACGLCWVPCVAMAGSQAWPVVMTAYRCRRIVAAITVCAWAGGELVVLSGGQVLVAGPAFAAQRRPVGRPGSGSAH